MIREISAQQIEDKVTRFIDSQFGTPAPDRVTFVEVASVGSFEKIHPSRAIHARTLHEAGAPRSVLPDTGIEIVIVSEAPGSPEVWETARFLESHGYGNVYVHTGGRAEWGLLGLNAHCTEVDADGFLLGPAITPLEIKLRDEEPQRRRTPAAR